MLSLSDNNQTDIIETFNYTSRYLDDLLNIDNPYFEQMVGQIYPTEVINKGYFSEAFRFKLGGGRSPTSSLNRKPRNNPLFSL